MAILISNSVTGIEVSGQGWRQENPTGAGADASDKGANYFVPGL